MNTTHLSLLSISTYLRNVYKLYYNLIDLLITPMYNVDHISFDLTA